MMIYIKLRLQLIAFLIMLSASLAFSQSQHLLKGVINYGDKPVADVSVSIEGNNTEPVFTDQDGTFTLTIPSMDVWILIQPIDTYKAQRINVNFKDELSITLVKLDFPSKDDLISTPFGDRKRKNILTGFSSVSTDKIKDEYIESADQFLQGKVAGVNVVNNSGAPGDGTFSTIRGISSVYSNAQPLYIIDGIPFENAKVFSSIFEGYSENPLGSVNPLDITDITLLKGVAAGAVYGSKASKGIVHIRTLKPDQTTTTIDFRAMGGVSFSPAEIPVLNASQFRTYANEMTMSSGFLEENIQEIQALSNNPTLDNYYRFSNNTNWQNEIFTNSMIQDYYLSIKGGDAISKYGVSLGYTNYEGIIKNTNLNRLTMRMVGDFNILEWLKLEVSTAFSMSTSALKESGFAYSTSPIYSALHKAPIYAPYMFDAEGEKLKFLDDAVTDVFGVSNPTAIAVGFEGDARTHKLTSSANLIAQLSDNLLFTSMIGINLNRKRENKFVPSTGILPEGEIYNYAQAAQNHYNAFYNDSKLSFSRQSRNSTYLLTAGFRVHTNNFEYDFGTGRNLHPSNQIKTIQNGIIELSAIGGDFGVWNWMSTYIDLDYSYLDRYLLNVSASLDGSSRTGEDADYDLKYLGAPAGLFYSARLGWRISEEGFLKDISILDDLKFRLSYGKSGNDDIGNYASRRYYETKPYRSIIGMISNIVPNTSLKYEELNELATGFDLALFGQRLQMNADFYSIVTNDLLIYEELPVWYGVDLMPKNDGSMKTTGWELDLKGRLIDSRFKLDIGMNIGAATSKIIEMSADTVLINVPGGTKAYIKGEDAGVFFGYETDGIYKTYEQAQADGYVDEVDRLFSGGDVRFVNHSGNDNVINEQDRTIIGNPSPDFFGGFYVNAALKNWSLSSWFQFSLGNDIYNYSRQNMESMSDFSNQSTKILNRWVSDGHNTDVPRLAYGDPMGNARFSDRWIEDGSYLRLKNITLNYQVPNVKSLNSINIFLTAYNLFSISKYLGYDPEFSYSNAQIYQGIDYGLIPQSKKIMIGVKLGL